MDFYPVGSFPEEAAVWFAQALAAEDRGKSATPMRRCYMTNQDALMQQISPGHTPSAKGAFVAALMSLFKPRGDH